MIKHVLITGANSYIGTSVETYLNQWPADFEIDTIDVQGDTWKSADFSIYDAVFHVAGIAHVSSDPNLKDLYYKVNRDLAIDIAKHAKASGVKQFVFMSSIIVYGEGEKGHLVINKRTKPNPKNFYGDSKLQAEQGIQELEDKNFNVVIMRPPMIYGKGSKGNYPRLAKLAQKVPLFPDYPNKRSMLHIDNLCELIRILILLNKKGIYFPQNGQHVRTSEMVLCIGVMHDRQIRLTSIFDWIIKPLIGRVNVITKMFGDLYYEYDMSVIGYNYVVRDFEESIRLTELEDEDKER